MDIFGLRIEWRGGKPLGNLRQTQEHVIKCEERLNKLEKHRTSVAVKTERQDQMDDEIAQVLAGSTTLIEQPEDFGGLH